MDEGVAAGEEGAGAEAEVEEGGGEVGAWRRCAGGGWVMVGDGDAAADAVPWNRTFSVATV